MTILGLDTSTDVCSVAIFNEDGVIVHRESERDFSHASLLNKFIEECIASAGLTLKHLDAISVASGPGSYTGLRVGASTAKGLCFGLDIPLIAIDSITSLAYGVGEGINDDDALIVPMLDARREEVYTAVFDLNKKRLTEIEKIIIDQSFFDDGFGNKELLLCGNGYEKFIEKLDLRNCTFLHVDSTAATLCQPSIIAFKANNFENIDNYSPFYLSDPKITASKKNIFL